jgi:Tfp pilus assembly protein PilF
MSTTVVPIVISIIAVAISKSDADYDKGVVRSNYAVHEIVVADHNVRQEILARQALPLAESLRRQASSRELTVLAGTLARIHDNEAAHRLYVRALTIAGREGPGYLSNVHQDFGNFLFDVGDLENGSIQLQRAAGVLPAPRGDRSLQRRFQCLGMRAVRHAEYKYQLDVAQRLLEEASELLEAVRTRDYRDEMLSDLKDYKSQLKEARGGGSRRTVAEQAGRRRGPR